MTGPRILFVVNHAGFFLSHRLPIAVAAAAEGYEVHVATPPSRDVARITEARLTWHELHLSRSGINPLREAATIRALLRLYRTVKPDLTHHVTPKPVLYGTWAARRAGVPAVVNAISGLGYIFSAGRLSLAKSIVGAAYRLLLRHPRMKVIFQIDEHRQTFVRRKWVRPDETVVIAGSGVDIERFSPANHVPAPKLRVTFASRMLYTKGVADFVEAARMLRSRTDLEFNLVGNPDPDNPESLDEETLRAWHASGVIRYCGRREDMPVVFGETDIFCLPSHYGEGIPKVILEASASGIPVVTTNWPGCRDAVIDGVTGILVPIKDPAALADAIERLARSPEQRAEMGRRGREKAVSDHSLADVVDRTLAVYSELTG